MLYFLEQTGGEGGGAGGSLMPILMIVGMLAVMYFMMIRPESKRKKEAAAMRDAVKVGDEILTIGGIVGTVVVLKEDRFVIETSGDQVRIELAKWALSSNESAVARAKEEAKKAAEAKAKAKAEKKANKGKK
jgi:preprotein translocase subunit YajC